MSAPGSQVTPVIDLVSPNTHTVPRLAVHTRRHTPQEKFDQPSLTFKYQKELLDLYGKCAAEARTLGIPVLRVNHPYLVLTIFYLELHLLTIEFKSRHLQKMESR